ncbi:hypothetical protein L3Q67_00955 [Saccharothrix sp. AJ9571]|nr:hypothetical protein L3Q67_00955 [Saccharothrix sp. AJ9571]
MIDEQLVAALRSDSHRFRFGFKDSDESWMLDFDDIDVGDLIELEKVTGVVWGQLLKEWAVTSALSIKAFFWLAKRKAGDTTPFDKFGFPMMRFRLTPVEPVVAPAPAEGTGTEDTGTEDTGTGDAEAEDAGAEDTPAAGRGNGGTGRSRAPRATRKKASGSTSRS